MSLRALFPSILILFTGCATAPPRTRELPIEYSEKLSGPRDLEVCFSPDEHCDATILGFIEGAKKSIDMAAYELTLIPMRDELVNLSKKIRIRIVVDRKEATRRSSLVSDLRAAGVEIRYGEQSGLMHDKFTLVDGNRIETGSFNYSEAAVRRNQENQVYLTSPEVVARFMERFQKIWDAALKP